MAQEGRGKRTSFPDSIFEIDEFDTNWANEDGSGVDLMREPSLIPAEPGSEIQATGGPRSKPPAEPEPEHRSGPFHEDPLDGFGDGLPLVHPDLEATPANQEMKPTVPIRPRPELPLELDLDLEEPPLPPRISAPVAEADESTRRTAPGDPTLGDARDRYAMGDYSGALAVAEQLLAADPQDEQAQRYADSCRRVLEQMFVAKLGSLDQTPRVAVTGDRLRWLSLDHRAGFVLSLIDGTSTVEELLDISGMPRIETLRTLCDLVEQNVVVLTRN
jgi:hypothetical protein